MTQEDLAALLLVDVTTIQRWEAGKTEPSIRALQQLKNFFQKRRVDDHPLLDAWLGLDVPVAVLDEHAVYRRVNSAFLQVLGFGDRAEVVGHYCLDVCPIWARVVSEQPDTMPEELLFGSFSSVSIAEQLTHQGKPISATHHIWAVRQEEFSSVILHEIDVGETPARII